MENKSLLNALHKALVMEERGYNFYMEASRKSENSITKSTFKYLADNEMLHIDQIKKFYDNLSGNKGLPPLRIEDVKAEREQDAKIFTSQIRDLKEKIKKSDSDKEACEFAMNLENDGYKYYEEMLKGAEDENLAALLKFLLREETGHYEGIKGLYTYITDPENWFMYDEKSFPQG